MDTTTQIDGRPPRRTRPGRLGPLLGAVGVLLLVLVSRFVTSNLVIHQSVVQRSCQGGFCVERVHAPDLLFVPGNRKVRVGHDADGPVQGRYYGADDPFGDYSDVTITWKDGGVSLTDGAATLSWSAQTLGRIDD
jgi:hypothetical protein